MAGRKRNTKALAQRIDRQYFHRMFPLQRWRLILSAAAVIAGVLWLGIHAASHDSTVYSAGPLTHAHAMLGHKCTVCHVPGNAPNAAIADQVCSKCHNGAVHEAQQAFTPACIDCHREHTSTSLTAVRDSQCTACHADLKVRSGSPAAATTINSFSEDHPEFVVRRLAIPDPGQIKFNHAIHLKHDLRGPSGNVTLACSDCHRPGNTEPWPYGKTQATVAPSAGRKYMGPVNYYEHCSACHRLAFDRRFAEPAPHAAPDTIHPFLVQQFSAWLAAHPGELRTSTADIRIPGAPAQPVARTPAVWIAARVAEAEQLMRVKTCKECHEISAGDQGIPPIPQVDLTARWFKHAEFDHSAHQMIVCESCHQKARISTKTSDGLLPGIAVCRQCHVSGKTDGAGANCVECHLYHDPAKHKHVEGSFTADQIAGGH
jgi:hypothetical protein